MDERGSAQGAALAPLVPLLLAVLTFLPALSIGFFRDDFGWVEGALRGRDELAWLLEPAKTDFRPIPKLTVLLNLLVSGIDPRGYAAFNLLVHAANTTLLYALVRRLALDPRAAFVGATLFAVGTGHYGEAVYWMSGRTGLLADLWSLCALLAYDRRLGGGPRHDALLAFAFFGLGLLTKETAVVLPLVLLALEWLRRTRPLAALRRLAPHAVLALVYVAFELLLLRSDSDVVGGDFALGGHMIRNFGEYFARMVLPVTPSSMLVAAPPALVPVLRITSAALTVIAPLAVLALALHPRVPRAARFGALWAMLAILPYVALTFRTSTRYLYGPAQGMALVAGVLAALALERAAARSPSLGRAVRSAGVAALALLVVIQCAVLQVAMNRRARQQRAESAAAEIRLEAEALRRGIARPPR
jgi:hypothetical protein